MYDDASVATGVVLKLKLLYHKVNVNPLDDFSRSSYAFLSRDDFFVWGNSVGICDLQFLLKKSQSVLMQVKVRLKKYTHNFQITHTLVFFFDEDF